MMRTKGRKMTRIPVKQNRKGIPTPTPLHQGRRRHQSQKGKTPKLDSKIDSLEEKIRLIQGLNSFGNTDFSSMSWFPNMTVPPKFKAPEFEKYNGRGDPMIHLQMYCRKMAPYADNEPLLIQTFQDTLTGNAAEWYSQLKKISHWKELADTFLGSIRVQLPNSSGSVRSSKDGKEEQRRPSGNMPKVGERIEDALKTKKIVDMTALMALAEQAAKKAPTKKKEGDVQMIGRSNGRPRQVLPTFTMQSVQPRPTQDPGLLTQVPAPAPAPQMPARPVGNQPNDNRWPRKEPRQFTPLPMPMTELYPILIEKNLISPTIPRPYNGAPRKDFNQNLTCDFHFGEFEGLPNITTNPLPNHPEGGVNMVEIEEGNEERILWRRLFYTLEKKRHITPLEAPPGPSTGDACEYHSGARGHSLECCEEFKKKITDLMENGLVGREEIPSERSHQPEDPSDFDWYAELNLDDIVEDEMDLDNLQDEGADWGYFMEDDTDEWRDVDFTKFFQFPCLIVPPGFETPEFEIFYENGDPEVHLQKYGEKMALHLENELLMISVFPESLSKQAAAWFYQLRNLTGWDDLARVFLERYRFNPHSILEVFGEKKKRKVKPLPPAKDPDNAAIAEEGEEPLKAPPPSNIITTTGEEPREVKIGTRCTTEQKEALIALLREFHEIFAWSYQDMPGLDTDIVVHKIPLKPECKPVKQALRRMKPEVILKIKEGSGKAIEGRFPKHSNLFGLGSQYSPGAERRTEKLESTNAVFSFHGRILREPLIKRAMVTLFHDMIHHEIEVYVDDMIAKSRTAQDHLTDLRKAVPATEEVSAQIEPEQVCLRRHIRKLTATCEPLFKLLRKDVKIKWTEDCQRAFDKIKEYLLNPPILVPPTPGRPLILYLTVQEASMGCMLGQQDETGKKEQAIYYLQQEVYGARNPLLNSQTKDVMTVDEDNHGRWKLYFDGAANAVGSGIGAVLVSPKGQQTPIAVKLGFDCTNNMTEYEACIVGLQAALEFGAYELEVFGDSLLIVSQTNGEWQARDPKLIPYQRYISRLVPKFKYVTFTYTPRAHNHFADALATLASLIKLVEGDDVRPLRNRDSRHPGILCVHRRMHERRSRDRQQALVLRYQALHPRQRMQKEANRLIQEMHAGLMGAHANGPFLARKIMRAGYYWLTMERDCIRHVQTCHKCQMYQNSKNAPPQYLHTMASPWPFSAWGMDVIGAITPKASNGHEFILVAIDYFTKWVEACSFKNVTQVAVTRFVKNNIICRYGMPEMLITDNASNLNNRMMDQLCQQFKIQHHNSAPYRPKMNGAVEAANKERHPLEPPPYSLVYGMEAVLPVEVEIPSLRILSQTQLEEAEWAQARYEQLNFIDEKRLAALCHGQLYQRRIERAYNKKARPRTFQPGDLVLKKRNMALSDPRGKFAPSYEGPYVVKKAFSGGAIILADMDGEEFRSPINSDSVIKYHV
uniref:Uncharacterized protein n=1 Tax=Fagus sylvatica TaxID=28930 RepID=A0A2N9GT35_FAGSY